MPARSLSFENINNGSQMPSEKTNVANGVEYNSVPQNNQQYAHLPPNIWQGSNIQIAPPVRLFGYGVAPPVSLNKFSGDVMEYLEFKRKFNKFVEEVYFNDDVRMTYLQSLCIGEAGRAARGLSGYTNQTLAYQTAWKHLPQRFGNYNLLVNRVREDMLNGPPIKEFDASALNSL